MKSGIKKFAVIFLFVAFVFSIGLVKDVFAAGKIAFVDLATVFDGYEKTKEYDVKLESTQKEKQTEIDKRVNAIKEMQNKLPLLSDQEKKGKETEISTKTKELQEFQSAAEIDLREERNERLKEVLQDIQNVVEEIAKANQYDFILNDRVLLYGNDALDISKEVLSKINEKYKSKKK
jgi:outer membrane protein